MKKTFTFFSLLLSIQLFANQGGPDTWGYKWYDSNDTSVLAPVYSWIDITSKPTATQVKLLADDNTRGPFVMNFDFHFYWYEVNQFWVGSNGYIIFEDGQLASGSPWYGKSQDLPNNYIGAFMNDLNFLGDSNPGQCWYWIDEDYDTLIVSWLDVPYYDIGIPGYSGSNTLQMILSAVDSSITFQYENVDPTAPTFGAFSYAGIENNSGNIGLWWSNNTSGSATASPGDFYAIKYVYPQDDTVQVSDPGILYNDNPNSQGIFINQSTPTFALNAVVQNYGNQTLNPVEVVMKVRNPSNIEIINNTQYSDTLDALETQTLTSPNSLIPDTAGTYIFTATSFYSTDNSNKNNTKNLEIVVIDTTLTEMWLGYDGGQTNGLSSVSWVGSNGGAGMHFIPPFYPCIITKLNYWISSNFNNVDFTARLLDDDGINGLPFSQLDSFVVTPTDIILNNWTVLELAAPAIINSGGFYISWTMNGEGMTLGAANKTPISHRSFEVFEYGWGIYRFGQDQDPMIAATIEKYSFPTGVTTVEEDQLSLQVFPNPASDQVNVLYNLGKNNNKNVLLITDIQGKELKRIDITAGYGTHQLTLDISQLPAGVYFAALYSGKEKSVQKLVITE